MDYVIEYVSNLLYVVCFIAIGELFLGFHRYHRKYEHLILLVIMLVPTILWFELGIFEKLVIHVLSIALILWVYFKEKKRVLLLFYLGAVPLLGMLSSMFEMVVSECLNFMGMSLYEDAGKIIAQVLLVLYIVLFGVYFKKKHNRNLKDIGFKYFLLFSVLLFIDSGIVLLFGSFVMNELQVSRKGVFVVLYIGVVCGILLQIVLLINALLTRNVYKENEKLAKQFLEIQKEHYLYLEKREEETKKFRHDIRNHLLVLGDHVKKHDYEGAEEYLNSLNEKVGEFGNKISINNGIADAVINKFYEEAHEKKIHLEVNGRFPEICSISGFDICTILSNLLSNAILAESQYGGDSVLLDISYTDEELFIIIENDYAHELKIENGIYKTTKSDSAGHGYGMKNIKESVKKNEGHLVINKDDNRFKVMISMRNVGCKDEDCNCG